MARRLKKIAAALMLAGMWSSAHAMPPAIAAVAVIGDRKSVV